jgi:hypothetical protein
MQQKQLANVLVKILGLYFGVEGVVRAVSGVLNLLAVLTSRSGFGSVYAWVSPFTGLIMAAIGLFFILLSRPIADILFKDE